MNIDEMQDVWQAQNADRKITVDADMLLKEVKGNKASFEKGIFWRDFREVGIAIVLGILFFNNWLTKGEWPWIPVALSMMFVGAFMLVDRILQKKKAPSCADTLPGCIETSLRQIEHQIWLLRNVLWWYLMPPGIAFMILFAYQGFNSDAPAKVAVIIFGISVAFFLAVFTGVYFLNQMAVKKMLMPRRQELDDLLENLRTQ